MIFSNLCTVFSANDTSESMSVTEKIVEDYEKSEIESTYMYLQSVTGSEYLKPLIFLYNIHNLLA